MLGSELWESKFNGLLSLVKEYIVDLWEIRKHKLYDSGSEPSKQLPSQSSPGDLAVAEGQRNGKFSLNGKFGQNVIGHSCVRVTKGKFCDSRVRDRVIVQLGLNVNSSAHDCGCVVNGSNLSIIIIITSLFSFFTIDINIFSFHNNSKEIRNADIHNPVTQITEFKVLGQCTVIICYYKSHCCCVA